MKKYAMQYKKVFKNQAGMNLTPDPPSQNSHVVRWHCIAQSEPYCYYYFYSAFSPDQSVLNFCSTATRLQRRSRRKSRPAPPSSTLQGNVTSAGWQVTLWDPMWHVNSRSGVATLRTAIHLLLTYLLTPVY